MADSSTSIFDLPSDPTGGGNISMNVSEMPMQQQQPLGQDPSSAFSLDQGTINQIVSGLQKASSSGATQLPSRDIPMNTANIVNDQQVQPNYVPKAELKDYIRDYEDNDGDAEDIVESYNKNARVNNSLDDMYSELQTPILIAVLFFLFQLPIIRKKMFVYVPALFSKDGNLNISGFIFMSIFFGLTYYVVNKTMIGISTF